MIQQRHAFDTGRAEGERRKAETLAVLAARRAIHLRRAKYVLLYRCLEHGTATADDVYSAVHLPDDIDARCLGAVPGSLAKAGLIRRVRFAKSNRPERHASYISVWEVIDRGAAIDWLRTHPVQQPDSVADAASLFSPYDKPGVASAGLGKMESRN